MKIFNRLFYVIAIALVCCFSSKAKANPSPIKHLSLSLWSEYQQNDFDELTQDQKTTKLQKIFKDKLNFAHKHGIRRLIVKILDPMDFEFFHPDNFTYGKDDNFYHWACKLCNHATLEALFDCSSFNLTSDNIFDRITGCYVQLRDYVDKQSKPFGEFQNVIEKMEWVAWTNEIFGAQAKNRPLIAGITLDPKGTGSSTNYYQNLVNAFDQFRMQPNKDCCVPEWIPENSYSDIRIAMLLPLDMQDFAIANAASIPIHVDMRDPHDRSKLGITPPSLYPSLPPQYPIPKWRTEQHKGPMLDTVYLDMGDPRLVRWIYQENKLLPNPSQNTKDAVTENLATLMEKVFQGKPFIKGPGFISTRPSTTVITGSHTFFRTGGPNGEGQFSPNSLIEVRPPFVSKTVLGTVTNMPQSNHEMTLSSPLYPAHDVDHIEYWHAPIPCRWASLKLSNQLRSRLYFVFSTSYDSQKDRFLGNWSLANFLQFIGTPTNGKGFLNKLLFMGNKMDLVKPCNNIVLGDFSTIPNGANFPGVNWRLGNQSH